MVCTPAGELICGIVGCITTMASLFDRKLLVLTGKGGVGKTTVSAALGLLAADRGLRTIVVEMGQQRRLAGALSPRRRPLRRRRLLRRHRTALQAGAAVPSRQ